jgi:hypothetical protein
MEFLWDLKFDSFHKSNCFFRSCGGSVGLFSLRFLFSVWLCSQFYLRQYINLSYDIWVYEIKAIWRCRSLQNFEMFFLLVNLHVSMGPITFCRQEAWLLIPSRGSMWRSTGKYLAAKIVAIACTEWRGFDILLITVNSVKKITSCDTQVT